MIVRENKALWLLISQVEHARIAAEIAAKWRLAEPLEGLCGKFVSAVEHHDDGWRDWEQAPTIDADGDPRDFMEMPIPVATGIWTASIEAGARSSPWGGLWISRHFCYLAELALEHRDDPADRAAAQQFIKDQHAAQRRWRAEVDTTDISPIEQAGLHALQFFDRVSLWLCCAERTVEQMIPDPAGGTTLWTPESASVIRVASERFNASELVLSTLAVAIERRPYADDSDLRTAIAQGQRTSVNWTLRRSEADHSHGC